MQNLLAQTLLLRASEHLRTHLLINDVYMRERLGVAEVRQRLRVSQGVNIPAFHEHGSHRFTSTCSSSVVAGHAIDSCSSGTG